MPDEELPLSEAPPPPAEKGPSREDWESLQRQVAELRESERYWADRARSGGQSQESAPPPSEESPSPEEFLDPNEPPPVEDDTPEKLVDEFASQGVAALSKRGFIKASDAKRIAAEVAVQVSQELINRERHKMGNDQELVKRFPDLLDSESELFKETSLLFKHAGALDPKAAQSIAVLTLAAEAASQRIKNRKPAREEDEYEAPRRSTRESEEGRRARIAAQGGLSNGRHLIEDIESLGRDAAHVIKQMGVSQEEFSKSKKELGIDRPRRR